MVDSTEGTAGEAALPPCQNCGTPMLGPHCYRCGRPRDGLVRHFTSIVGDFFDSVFELDARTPRTLWPLFARPGFLTLEYFAGRRVRYVSPVRLFVFLSIAAFFVAQLTVSFGNEGVVLGDNDTIARATTEAEVVRLRDIKLAKVEKRRRKAEAETRGTPAGPGLEAGMDAADTAIRAEADKRIAALREAAAKGLPPPVAKQEIYFGGDKPWNPETNPLTLQWLPGFANRWVNHQIARAEDNVARMRQDPDLFKDALLGAIPSTLFVLLPVFALMLKVLYLFKRRLYMEHLIVALHSHAFMCLSLLLVFLLQAGRDALGGGAAAGALATGQGLLYAWMPLYLLVMQKRVYRQGWIMTLLKYSVLGVMYVMLLSFGAVFTVLASLVWM